MRGEDAPAILRIIRRQRKISSTVAGSRLGCSPQLIRQIEGGFRPMTPDIARKIEETWKVKGLEQAVRFGRAAKYVNVNELYDFVRYVQEGEK